MFPIVLAAALQLLSGHLVAAGNFRGSVQLVQSEMEASFQDEMADLHHHVPFFEDQFRQMYTSLPKNAQGLLGHQVVRYALHRFFKKQYKWQVKGLDPQADKAHDYSSSTYTESWVPNFLQERQESLMGDQGADLHGLAVLAASFQDLVDKEIEKRIKFVYDALKIQTDGNISHQSAISILETYLIAYLNNNNVTVDSTLNIANLKKAFAEQYDRVQEVTKWLSKQVGEQPEHDLKSVLAVAGKMGQTYHSVNEDDCTDLRSTLQSMEGQKPGRVRISVFYNTSKHSIWRFTESVAWLRAHGALDESDPQSISVIIPNYLQSQINCIDATSLYSVCCSNPCEDLAASLEGEIGASHAETSRIVELVSKLPSASVAAPRELSEALLGRLQDIAVQNRGKVPMHGRLFAQWMHHAYPLECPYPHEASVNLQNAEAWEKGEVSKQASEEEMDALVAADQCAVKWDGKVDCGEESTDIPWSSTEELLVTESPRQTRGGAKLKLLMLVVILLGVAVAVQPTVLTRLVGELDATSRNRLIFSTIPAVSMLAFYFGLLDSIAFFIAVVGSIAGFFLRPRGKSCKGLPMAKTV